MELARNPAMLQELMRSQDRAMSNLEVHLSLSLSLKTQIKTQIDILCNG